ncbi:MAG: hypothetical protein JWQ43_2548 [Glaciihabitans sp.]|nr:hypothetical protein [Glaciihabitans sp.]
MAQPIRTFARLQQANAEGTSCNYVHIVTSYEKVYMALIPCLPIAGLMFVLARVSLLFIVAGVAILGVAVYLALLVRRLRRAEYNKIKLGPDTWEL